MVRLKNSVIMPETNASLRKKQLELKAQIDVLTDELKKLKTQFTVQTNVGSPLLASVPAEGLRECL